MSICLFAGPNSIPLTLLAKFSEQRVSLKSFSLGLICTNIRVLESPPDNTNPFVRLSIFLSAYISKRLAMLIESLPMILRTIKEDQILNITFLGKLEKEVPKES